MDIRPAAVLTAFPNTRFRGEGDGYGNLLRALRVCASLCCSLAVPHNAISSIFVHIHPPCNRYRLGRGVDKVAAGSHGFAVIRTVYVPPQAIASVVKADYRLIVTLAVAVNTQQSNGLTIPRLVFLVLPILKV